MAPNKSTSVKRLVNVCVRLPLKMIMLIRICYLFLLENDLKERITCLGFLKNILKGSYFLAYRSGELLVIC